MKKRLISTVLTLALLASTVPAMAGPAYAADQTATPLAAERIPAAELPEEGDFIYFGTAAAELGEARQLYSVPVYRTGDLSEAAAVEVRSLDLTAVYGKDYEVVGAAATGDGKSVLERYAAMEAAEAPDGEAEPEKKPETAPASDKEAEPDALQALVAEQTGVTPRELYETPEYDLMESILSAYTLDALDAAGRSSSLTLRFAPGESVATVFFRILDDSESEGTEGFTLYLTEPEGAELYSVSSLSVSILDDEPLERSSVRFSAPRYDAENGTAQIAISRAGAEYSLCDFTLTADGEALGTVAFAPYQTEQTVEIPIAAGETALAMEDLKGCDAGVLASATVRAASAPVKLAEAGNNSLSLLYVCHLIHEGVLLFLSLHPQRVLLYRRSHPPVLHGSLHTIQRALLFRR